MARDYSLNRVFWYSQALGDTVMEKYEALYIFLMGLQSAIGGEIRTVICGPALAELFSVHSVFQPDPLCQDVRWPEGFEPPQRTCYRIGEIHGFEVVLDRNLAEGHMYVIGNEGLRKVEVPDWMS